MSHNSACLFLLVKMQSTIFCKKGIIYLSHFDCFSYKLLMVFIFGLDYFATFFWEVFKLTVCRFKYYFSKHLPVQGGHFKY